MKLLVKDCCSFLETHYVVLSLLQIKCRDELVADAEAFFSTTICWWLHARLKWQRDF